MTYEYESDISNSISKNKDYFFTTTAKDMKDELQEVYRKAKAFNKIAKLIESNYVDYGDNNLEDVETIVNGYWEDE